GRQGSARVENHAILAVLDTARYDRDSEDSAGPVLDVSLPDGFLTDLGPSVRVQENGEVDVSETGVGVSITQTGAPVGVCFRGRELHIAVAQRDVLNRNRT